nr:zinc finger, CCHC-type [Tanacetum cinerariifolium]
MDFSESGEYKKTFIGSGVGTGSMQVLHGFKFEVEPLGDHTFEMEPQENVDQRAGLQEAGLKDDMDARSDVYVLSNGCRKCSDDNDDYYWEYAPDYKQTYRFLWILTMPWEDPSLSWAWKKEIWLKGLLTESGYELRLVAGVANGALMKGCSQSEVPAQVKVVAYRY